MRISAPTRLSVIASLGLCLTAKAISPGPPSDHYKGIAERNVFGLKSPEEQPEPAATKAPPPKLVLTGITTVLGNKLALMEALLPAASGTPGKEKPLMLAEGQRDGNVEVLQIDEKTGSVRVNDYGTVVTLTFVKDGVKTPAAPAAVPGSTTQPLTTGVGTGYEAAGTNAYLPAANPYLNTRMRVLPTRTPRLPAAGGGNGAGLGGTVAAPAQTGVAQPATQPAATPSPTGAATQLTPEEQQFLLQLEQEATQSTPSAAPPPPAPLPVPPGVLPPGADTQRTKPPLMPQ